MKSLIEKRVIVFWTTKSFNSGSDWPAFLVIDSDDKSMWCQGVASPNGTPHDGTKAAIYMRDLNDVIEWKEGA